MSYWTDRYKNDPEFREREIKRSCDKRKKNKDWHNANYRRFHAKLKKEVFEAYGNKCTLCGYSNQDCLVIDHTHNDGNIERKNSNRNDLWIRLRRENYPKDRYQLLCRNCNWKKFILSIPPTDIKVNNYARQSRQRIRNETIKEYGEICIKCYNTDIDVLTIDHIEGNGSRERRELFNGRNLAGTPFYRWLKKNGYPKDKYQCLCHNCNWSKRVIHKK